MAGICYVIAGEVKALRHMEGSREAVMARAVQGELFTESAIVVLDLDTASAILSAPCRETDRDPSP